MNYTKVFETLVDKTQKYLEDNHLHAMILGISGGLDSTVTAAICHEVEKRNPELKFYGISLPCTSNSGQERDSANICMKAFCKYGQYWTESIQKEYILLKGTCSQFHCPTTIGQGNIKARLRMIYLYDLANYTKGLVMDTDNLTEHYLGFFTIHGDVCDYNPIGGLWKHEVYELAKYLLYDFYGSGDIADGLDYKEIALKAAIGITPTDGNGVNDFGDMGQIAPAFAHDKNVDAYTKVDDIIQTYFYAITQFPDECDSIIDGLREKYDVDNDKVTYKTVDGIIQRIKSTEYKRKGLPVVIQRSLYENL